MTPPLPAPLDREAIERLLEQVISTDWAVEHEPTEDQSWVLVGHHSDSQDRSTSALADFYNEHDAKFCAAARTLIPQLLAALVAMGYADPFSPQVLTVLVLLAVAKP